MDVFKSRNLYDWIIYTDGSCFGNPGIGGYAAMVFNKKDQKDAKLARGGDYYTTNNRMELTAVIKGLELIDERKIHKPKVLIVTDSKYVANGINHPDFKEYASSSKRTHGDLWEEMLEYSVLFTINAEWVKGHSGDKYNEQCDNLAGAQAQKIKNEKQIMLTIFKEIFIYGSHIRPEFIVSKYKNITYDMAEKYISMYQSHLCLWYQSSSV